MSGVQPTTSANPATSGGSGGQQKNAPQQGHSSDQTPAPAGHQPAVSLSASLAPVSAGQRLEGQFIGQNAEGVPVLRTDNGAFLLRSEQILLDSLPQNSRIAVQILTVGNTLRAVLLGVNGQALHPPPEIALELSRAQLPALPGTAGTLPGSIEAAANNLAGPPAPDLRAGAPLSAKILVAAPELLQGQLSAPTGSPYGQNQAAPGEGLVANTLPPSVASGATTGTTLLLRILGISAPPNSGASTVGPAVELPTSQQIQPRSAGTPANTSGPPGAPGLGATPQSSTPPTSLAPSPHGEAITPPGSVTGVVTGQGASGLVLLRTSLGILGLQTQAPLAPGTVVTVEVVSKSPPAETGGVKPLIAGDLLIDALDQGRGWPALKDAMEILQALGAHHAHKLVAQTLPTPTANLASAFLFFLSAVRGGDVRNWIGRDAANTLERAGRGDLMRQLGEDFQQVSNINSDSVGDWRSLLLPFYDGHDLHRLMLFYRHNEQNGSDGKEGEEGTRFVLNLEFTRLGPMQIDGLAQNGRFDLFIRTTSPLSDEIRHDISALFSEATSIGGLAGNIAFQTVREFPVSPMEEARSDDERGGLVV